MAGVYDVIIVGGGVVGLAGAMYSGRLEMKTLVLGDNIGGTILLTDLVENYPGFIRLTGQELIDKVKAHALDYKENVEIREEFVEEIKKLGKGGCFKVKTNKGEYDAKSIIIATGTKVRELKVPGHDKFRNKGVQYCALCDGAIFKDKTVGVVGGSDSSAKEALVLSRYAKKVYIIYRGDQIHGEPPNLKRVDETKNIEIITKTNVTEIKGDKFVKSVVLDNPYKGKKDLQLDGLFISIGHMPLSDLAVKLGVKVDENKEIIINRKSETNLPGAFAAGDVCDTDFKQAIVGVGEIVSAVYSAYKYISNSQIMCA